MLTTVHEAHIQCSCGGTLIVKAVVTDVVFDLMLRDGDENIFHYDEVLSFSHRGEFKENCLEFKAEALRRLKENVLRYPDLRGRFVSQDLHGL